MTDRSTDRSILERTRVGEPDALAELYSKYAAAVHRVAFRLTRSVEDADDVLQDVFAGLPEALRSFEGRGSLEGWLRMIAARRSLMLMRKKRIRRETDLTALSGVGEAGGSEPVVDRVDLERALTHLPPSLRAVFVLHEVEGYSHEEIGEMLEIGRSGSASKLHRARKALRDMLRGSR